MRLIKTYLIIFSMAFSLMPSAFAETAPADIIRIFTGRSSLIFLNEPLSRISVSDPKIADVTVINSKEIYILGKTIGTTNLILWNKSGKSSIKEVQVNVDIEPLQKSIKEVMPDEVDIHISTASGSIVLTGSVANIIVADQVNNLSEAFIQQINRASRASSNSNSPQTPQTDVSNTNTATSSTSKFQVINLLKIRDPQQVLLEVKIAEISKDLSEKLGVKWNGNIGNAGRWGLTSSFGLGGQGTIGRGGRIIDAQKDDTLYKVLAEPSIVAMSGQEGSFLVGGKIYIPQIGANGSVSTTEIPYGIGLKFVPTVLDKGRINLKIAPEVSSVSTESLSLGSNSNLTNIPKILTKTASTTVQIREGQTLVIGGLLSSEINEQIKAFPILGEIPILGALFRSKSFQSGKKELVVIVTPSLVAATDTPPTLPTDQYQQPSRSEFFFGGELLNKPSSKESGGR